MRAIHVYDEPVLRWEAYGPPEGAMLTSEQIAELEESLRSEAAQARRRAEALVEHTVAELDDIEDVKVDVVALRGRPASTLIEESKDTDLLMVGSRGRGGFKELVL